MTTRLTRTLATLVLICGTATTSAPAGPAPYVTENPDLSTTLDHQITRTHHYPRGWAPDSPWHERWEFCFDTTAGDWTCIPVTPTDYQRYQVGDRIQLTQHAGALAVITSRGNRP